MTLEQLGNVPRRFFYGPGINNFDLTLTKMLRITEGNHFRGFAPHPPFIPRRRGRGLHRSALSPGDRRGVPAVQCTLVHVGAWHAVEQPTLETNKGARSLLEVNELVRDDHHLRQGHDSPSAGALAFPRYARSQRRTRMTTRP